MNPREPHDSIDGVLYDVEAGVMDIPDGRKEIIEHIKKHYLRNLDESVRDITQVSVAPAAKSEVRRILTNLINTL